MCPGACAWACCAVRSSKKNGELRHLRAQVGRRGAARWHPRREDPLQGRQDVDVFGSRLYGGLHGHVELVLQGLDLQL
eukprot:1717219-Pyramimonas_sp.AAC.1